MPRRLEENVHVERSRHGRAMYYYRKGKGRRVRLPNDYGSPSFWAAVEDVKRTGCLPDHVRRHRFYTFDKNQKGNVGRTINAALKSASDRARQRGLPFDLDFDWATGLVEKQQFRCALSGIPFYGDPSRSGKRNPYAPSLDRIDCARGYTRDNVRIILSALNMMLSDWGLVVFDRIAAGVRANKKRRSIPSPPISTARTNKNTQTLQ